MKKSPSLCCTVILLAACGAALAGPLDTPVTLSGAAPNAHYDFGVVSLLRTPQLTHVYLLRNDGPTPVTVERFQPSCHCTTADLVAGTSLPVSLAPGQTAAVRVSVTVEPYLTGPLEKSVDVYAAGQDDPVATLTIDATLRPAVTLDPGGLDFGAVPAGQSRTLTLTATFDRSLLPTGPAPRLLASDPDLRVTALPVPPTQADAGTYTYRVRLASTASLGRVQDRLHFAPVPGARTVSGLTLADAPGVGVTGVVVGSASASPDQIALGIVNRGRTSAVPVTITARTPAALTAARVSTGSPALFARWGLATGRTRCLTVGVRPTATPGLLRSTLTVALRDGERLRLPVTAYVAAP